MPGDTMPGDSGKPRLRVNVLGNVTISVCVDGVENPLPLGNRKSRAVLGVLAMHDQRTISRERLAGLLWGAKEQAKAQGNLRNALYEVRRALTPMGLAAFINEDLDRHTITIDHGLVDVDIAEVVSELAKGRVHALLLDRERLFESLFDDLKRVDEEFESWVVTKRTAYGRRILDRVEDLMRSKTASQPTRELAARALSNLDPSNEEAVRLRMRLLAERGDSGAALSLFVHLATYLDDYLGSEPSPPTIDLNAAIKMGRVAVTDTSEPQLNLPPEPTLQLAPGERLVIGVCTFDVSALSEAARPYVDGFRGDLVGSLVQFREWDIHEPKRVWDPATWPRGRNGDYVIEARAIESDGAIRLTLSLHDLETMKVVDTQKTHLSRENWFTGQDDVIRQLARWLNVNVSEERIKAFGRATKDHPALAYDVWVKYHSRMHQLSQSQWFEAEKALLDLVAMHPEFDRGYATLATSYNMKHFVFPGVFRDRDLHENALELSRTAIRLDPKGTHGHRAAAYSYALLEQFELAEHHFRLALELNENDVWGSISASAGIGLCGNWEEAARKIKSAMLLTRHPTPAMFAYHAYNFFAVGDYKEVVKLSPHVNEVTFARAVSIAAKALSGDLRSAQVELVKFFTALRQSWASNGPSSDADITQWLVQMGASSSADVRQKLQDGLERAAQAPPS
jgi:DNA-binding SARP family transcriptional activator